MECMDKFIHGDFDIRYFENSIGGDFPNIVKWEIGKLAFKCEDIKGGHFDQQTSIYFRERSKGFDAEFHAEASAYAHLSGTDGETTFADIVRRFYESVCDGIM